MISNLEELVSFSNHLADESEKIIKQYFRKSIKIESKEDESPVTIADKSVELKIRELIQNKYPNHGILGEEFEAKNIDSEYLWVIDPIDGTRSFIAGHKDFGTLIALLHNNIPIVDIDDKKVPLNYFNIVKLNKDQSFEYVTPGYETCIVPATGSININIEGFEVKNLGTRTIDVWDGEPEGVYVPSGIKASFVALNDSEIFIAGAKFDKTLEPFAVRTNEIDTVQYGSDDTKTHRKIKHILGAKHHDKVGRLLCNELYTVGQGGWSGFPPHKHDTDRLPDETRHDETYNYRFRPNNGFGFQLFQQVDEKLGKAEHIIDGSTIVIDKGYHPCVVAPGYEMYYFTILGGLSQRSLVQYFQPDHAYQLETIPGIKDMIAKYK